MCMMDSAIFGTSPTKKLKQLNKLTKLLQLHKTIKTQPKSDKDRHSSPTSPSKSSLPDIHESRVGSPSEATDFVGVKYSSKDLDHIFSDSSSESRRHSRISLRRSSVREVNAQDEDSEEDQEAPETSAPLNLDPQIKVKLSKDVQQYNWDGIYNLIDHYTSASAYDDNDKMLDSDLAIKPHTAPANTMWSPFSSPSPSGLPDINHPRKKKTSGIDFAIWNAELDLNKLDQCPDPMWQQKFTHHIEDVRSLRAFFKPPDRHKQRRRRVDFVEEVVEEEVIWLGCGFEAMLTRVIDGKDSLVKRPQERPYERELLQKALQPYIGFIAEIFERYRKLKTMGSRPAKSAVTGCFRALFAVAEGDISAIKPWKKEEQKCLALAEEKFKPRDNSPAKGKRKSNILTASGNSASTAGQGLPAVSGAARRSSAKSIEPVSEGEEASEGEEPDRGGRGSMHSMRAVTNVLMAARKFKVGNRTPGAGVHGDARLDGAHINVIKDVQSWLETAYGLSFRDRQQLDAATLARWRRLVEDNVSNPETGSMDQVWYMFKDLKVMSDKLSTALYNREAFPPSLLSFNLARNLLQNPPNPDLKQKAYNVQPHDLEPILITNHEILGVAGYMSSPLEETESMQVRKLTGVSALQLQENLISLMHTATRRDMLIESFVSEDDRRLCGLGGAGEAHCRSRPVDIFFLTESLIRASYLAFTDDHFVADRFTRLIEERMKKLPTMKPDPFRTAYLHPDVFAVILQRQSILLKVFFYWATTRGKCAMGLVRQGGVTLSFNDVLPMMQELELLDAVLDNKALTKCFGQSVGHMEVLAQVHPNNQDCEMIFDEYVEFLARVALLLAGKSNKRPLAPVFADFLDSTYFPKVSKVYPSRLNV